ncbi:hypothetical protein AVEN_112925-1 [Araneus ventricosus]|uniref:Uncharacterized protein n=1 Tax=Araneus ventricosus TaxID=182803 RepID=A0A4Y2JQZ0_ARAVE|nr:hypothetical protein AVEN_112925-1 [Araneus ventricosus]
MFLHRRFRSRHLINLLHNLGWSVSYSEIYHNTRTVDGHGTFHVMGGVQCVTPASAVQTSSCIQRPKIIPTANIVGKFRFIPIVTHDWLKNHGLNRLVMENVLSLKLRPMDVKIGTIYHWIWMAGPTSAEEPHTGWSGFMEIAAGKKCYEKSAVMPLPFVNLQPFNPTSINTCLRFAAEEYKKRQQRCIVTFDQSLFIKDMDIVFRADETDELSKVIVKLNRFHLLMSYMGAVGKIMGGSSLEQMWCEVFAKKIVVHMANGQAYARVLRAHSLSQAAVGFLILEYCEKSGFLSGSDVETLRGIHNMVINLSSSEEYFLSKVKPLLSAVSSAMKTLEKRSRTAKLWLQYYKKVSLMHDFVRVERTGDWNLHLYFVQRMLVHLHTAGHIH